MFEGYELVRCASGCRSVSVLPIVPLRFAISNVCDDDEEGRVGVSKPSLRVWTVFIRHRVDPDDKRVKERFHQVVVVVVVVLVLVLVLVISFVVLSRVFRRSNQSRHGTFAP